MRSAAYCPTPSHSSPSTTPTTKEQFITADARTKLRRLYPAYDD